MHQSPNPSAVFGGNGTHFANPTWGYPKVYIPDLSNLPQEQQPEETGNWFTRWWRNLHWGAQLGIGLGTVALAIATWGISAKIKAKAGIAAGILNSSVSIGAKAPLIVSSAAKANAKLATASAVVTVSKGATIGSGIYGSIGAISGGMQDGWQGAASGFGQGSIGGFISGATFGQAWRQVYQ